MTESQTNFDLLDRDFQEVSFPALKARQPIGDIYVGSIPHGILTRIAYFDVRRVLQEERDIERYLGIQRPLSPNRVRQLERYVNFQDATFPTAVILAVDADYAAYDEDKNTLTIRNYREGEDEPSARIRELARVIDGQHRIAGLFGFEGEEFEVPVSVFIGSDVADQAYVFATVNLEQTKVSKSLAYDLFELARTRSPQRTCHQIAVALDADEASPFYRRIKRLGIATPGRTGELLTQATFVENVMRYITRDPKGDRDILLSGDGLLPYTGRERVKFIFRDMFISERDLDIGRVVFNYFNAVRRKWPEAWENRERGQVLNKTNGFRALMRVLGPAYNEVAQPGNVPSQDRFFSLFLPIGIKDDHFNTDEYPPGTSGEAALRQSFLTWMGLEEK